MKHKQIFILAFILALALLPMLSAETISYGWKYETKDNITLSTKIETSCFLKPNDINDGYKTCHAIMQGSNPDETLLNLSEIKVIMEEDVVKDNNYTYYFSNEYNEVTENAFNQTCYEEIINATYEDVLGCNFNMTRKEYYNWQQISEFNNIYNDTNFAYKADFEVLQDNSTNYNFSITYEDIGNIILDPMILSGCGSIISSGEYALNGDTSGSGTCMYIMANDVLLDGKDPYSSVLKRTRIGFGSMGGSNQFGIFISSSYHNITIQNFEIYDANPFYPSPYVGHDGIITNGENSDINIINNTITTKEKFSAGIRTSNGQLFNGTIEGNEIYASDYRSDAINIGENTYPRYANTTIKNNFLKAGQYGINFIVYANGVLVEGNEIESYYNGLYGAGAYGGSSNIVVKNNQFTTTYASSYWTPMQGIIGTGSKLVYETSYGKFEIAGSSLNGNPGPATIKLKNNWKYRYNISPSVSPPTPADIVGGPYYWDNPSYTNGGKPVYTRLNSPYKILWKYCGNYGKWGILNLTFTIPPYPDCPYLWAKGWSSNEPIGDDWAYGVDAFGGINVSLWTEGNVVMSSNFIGIDSLGSTWVPGNTTTSGYVPNGYITLYNIPTNFTYPIVFKDGIECSGCTNTTSLNAGNVTFYTQGWSNYSIGEGYIAPTEREAYRDSVLEVFTKTALALGILIIIALAMFFLPQLFLKDNESIGVFAGGDLTKTILIIVGALISIGVAIFIIANLLA